MSTGDLEKLNELYEKTDVRTFNFYAGQTAELGFERTAQHGQSFWSGHLLMLNNPSISEDSKCDLLRALLTSGFNIRRWLTSWKDEEGKECAKETELTGIINLIAIARGNF